MKDPNSGHPKTEKQSAQAVFKCQRNPQVIRNKGGQFKTGEAKQTKNYKKKTIPGPRETG